MITALLHQLVALPVWLALTVVFAVPALEASAFVGFLFPGQTALVVGGVLAAQGGLPLAAVLAVGIAGAIIGYFVGRRYGARVGWARGLPRVVHGRPARAGPGMAGMSGLGYREFLVWNIAGGTVWAAVAVSGGLQGSIRWTSPCLTSETRYCSLA